MRITGLFLLLSVLLGTSPHRAQAVGPTTIACVVTLASAGLLWWTRAPHKVIGDAWAPEECIVVEEIAKHLRLKTHPNRNPELKSWYAGNLIPHSRFLEDASNFAAIDFGALPQTEDFGPQFKVGNPYYILNRKKEVKACIVWSWSEYRTVADVYEIQIRANSPVVGWWHAHRVLVDERGSTLHSPYLKLRTVPPFLIAGVEEPR